MQLCSNTQVDVRHVDAGNFMPPSKFSEAAQCQMQVGKGSQLKLVINMMMGAIMAANAEGIELAQGLGLPVESLIEVVNMGAMGTPMFKLKVGLPCPFTHLKKQQTGQQGSSAEARTHVEILSW